MAIRFDYLEKTLAAGAKDVLIGEIRPLYQKTMVLISLWIRSTGACTIKILWQGTEWANMHSALFPDNNNPFEINWMIEDPKSVTIYATNLTTTSNIIHVGYEADEEAVIELKKPK